MAETTPEKYIVQLTDTHLFGDCNRRLMGADSNGSFLATLEQIKSGGQHPDLILMTGDLTQDDSIESYQWLREKLEEFGVPFVWTNGNHDHTDLMMNVCPEAMVKQVILDDWQIILLNSQIPGQVPGYLKPGELETLDACLTENPEKHCLVAFHHPAYKLDSHWLDEIGLQNSEAFLEALSGHENVRAVLNGHVHQEKDQVIQAVRFLSAPSTCVQFKPESSDFSLDDRRPGYRELRLKSDGDFRTKVIRLNGYQQSLDLEADGY